MKQKTILLFGGSGLIGTRIQELLFSKYKIIAPSRIDCNLLQKKQIEETLEISKPDFIVYAAGFTNQEKAEKDKEHVLQINAKAPGFIAKKAASVNIPLIYFSTDAVFKGNQSSHPYLETEITNPLNFYGVSKAKGEQAVLSAANNNLVLRLITVYTANFANKIDFARQIVKKLSKHEAVQAVTDQVLNPAFSDNVIFALSKAIDKKVSGILHIGATDYLTNFDFVIQLAKQFKFSNDLIIPVSLEMFNKQNNVHRPKYTWLDVNKTQKILGNNILQTNIKNLEMFYEEFI